MDNFKPMLAERLSDINKLNLTGGRTIVASPKLDGIRAINLGDGVLRSRSLKPIPNAHVQKLFGGKEFAHFDGELICGDPTSPSCYRDTNSAVMSRDGEPDVSWFVFDHFGMPSAEFQLRHHEIEHQMQLANVKRGKVVILEQRSVSYLDQLIYLEEKWLEQGYEGVMLRAPDGVYKFGRSTEREGILLKLKRFVDAEAEVVGFQELMSNQNEATTNALGHTERSMHQENMIPQGVLGALLVRDLQTGVEFSIGSGFDAKQRKEIWECKDGWQGKIVKYQHFPIGAKDKPRFPTFMGERSKEDMS